MDQCLNLTENQIASIIVDCSYQIHIKLGPGLLESVYEAVLLHELISKGMFVEKQKTLPVVWKDLKLNLGFRTDLIVNNKVIVEIKSVEEIHPVHPKQLLTYLRLPDLKVDY